jgi:hypothetical protein
VALEYQVEGEPPTTVRPEIHVDSQGLRHLFQLVRAGAEGWDGSEPLRPAAT